MNPKPLTLNHKNGFPTQQKDYYKVYVRSCTFNQAPYIEDCLNGVAMQETNFPFVHHVIDDASTDGEQDVIKAWMERNCDMEHAEYYDNDICTSTFVKNKKNPNCTLVAYFLKKNMYGNPKKSEFFDPWREVCPYEALCEGDDYWIDPNKLQKQVDFMDKHKDCSLCHTGFIKFTESTQEKIIDNHSERNLLLSNKYKQELVSWILQNDGYIISTLTVLIRLSALKKVKTLLIAPANANFLLGDRQMWACLAYVGSIAFIEKPMGVYHIHNGSASCNKDLKKAFRFSLSCSEVVVYYGNLLNQPKKWQIKWQKEFQREYIRYKLHYDPEYRSIIKFKKKYIIDYLLYILLNIQISHKLLRSLAKLRLMLKHIATT